MQLHAAKDVLPDFCDIGWITSLSYFKLRIMPVKKLFPLHCFFFVNKKFPGCSPTGENNLEGHPSSVNLIWHVNFLQNTRSQPQKSRSQQFTL